MTEASVDGALPEGTVPVGRRGALAVGLVLGVTTYAFDALSVTVAMPAVSDELGGRQLYGAAFSSFMLATLVSLAVSGPAADRRGPRPVLAVGLALFTAGLLLAGLAPTFGAVIAGRVVQGLGAGTIGACAYVVVGRVWAPDERARMFAVLSAAWVVPGLLAPGATGLIVEHLSWRVVFLGLVPFPVIAAVLSLGPLRALDERSRPSENDPPVRGLGLAALQLAAAVGVVLAGTQRREPVLVLAAVVIGVAVGLPALRRLLPPGTFRALPVLPALVAARAMLNWTFFGADAFVPFAITTVRGRSELVAGFALTSSSLAWAGGAALQARWAARASARRVIVGGAALLAVGIVVTAPVTQGGMSMAFAFVGWAIAGLGMGLAFNATSVAALGEASSGGEGATASALQLADALGVALSTGLAGALVTVGPRVGWSAATAVLAVFALAGVGSVPTILAARRLPA